MSEMSDARMADLRSAYEMQPIHLALNTSLEEWTNGVLRLESAFRTGRVINVRLTWYASVAGLADRTRLDRPVSLRLRQGGADLHIMESASSAGSHGGHALHKAVLNDLSTDVALEVWNSLTDAVSRLVISLSTGKVD